MENEGESSKSKCRRYCSVPQCKKRSGQMFFFPRDPEIRESWKTKCQILRRISNTMNICGDHFEKRFIRCTPTGQSRLMKEAMPTLKLPVPSAVVQNGRGRRCTVPGCQNTGNHGITFHRFPHRHERRVAWGVLCGMNKIPTINMRICSSHFTDADFYAGERKRLKHNQAIPSCNLMIPAAECQLLSEDESSSLDAAHLKTLFDLSESEGDNSDSDNNEFDDSSYFVSKVCKEYDDTVDERGLSPTSILEEVQSQIADDCDELTEKLATFASMSSVPFDSSSESIGNASFCESTSDSFSVMDSFGGDEYRDSNSSENSSKSSTGSQSKITLLDLLTTDKALNSFTGVTLSILNGLALLVEKCCGEARSKSDRFTVKEKIALTLCKLRLNLSFVCLAFLFGVDRRRCGEYFANTIHQLATVLRSGIYWPSKEEIMKNLPKCFQKFMDTRVVLDCTEIPVDHPDCLQCRLRLYSHYKKCQTAKVLIGVTPGGLICMISKVYGGRASDKFFF